MTNRVPDDKELSAIIRSMTVHEKAVLCSGLDAWRTKPNADHNIPSLRMADGPHGVRVEDRKNRRANGGNSKKSTCFPPQVCLACGWDPDLTREVGGAIAEECLHYGVGLLLGPGVNVKRSPLNGRNFEYYSEDPLLAGELAAGFINGVQERGVGTSLKHFAANNQERLRMSINTAVDDRALFDLYLKPFEIAVKKARPDTVMASYNRVNGTYATENRRLLTEILRLRFGFTGVVVSDWGAVNDRPAGIAAGMDLEMPASGGITDYQIEQAVARGHLAEDALDAACWNLLRLILRRSRQGMESPACDWDAHHALAEKALEKCAVLLKNDGMLPLADDGERIAVIGEMAERPRYQGGGSSVINPVRVTSFLSALKAAGKRFVYAPGYKGAGTSRALLAAAVAAAKTAGQVVLYLGLPDSFECEGYDREHLRLPQSQLTLLEAVAAVNQNICVVLCCGAPVETPWLDKARALLCPHLSGQAQGGAMVRLLYGAANPAGKLAETWPLSLADTPAYHHFPMGPNEVTYNESIFVGYRYYDTADKPVQFPFGFGLSYTHFAYTGLTLSGDKLDKDGTITASLTVKNTGARDGEEIVQLYLSRASSATYQAEKELIAFSRVALAAGEEKAVAFDIPYDALAFYVPAFGKAVVEKGGYSLLAGGSSRDLPLCAAFTAEGADLPRDEDALAYYSNITGNDFPDEGFAAVYKGRMVGNTPLQKGQYGPTTPLSQMHGTLTGRLLLGAAHLIAKRTIHFSTDRVANRKAAREMTLDLPFKNIMLNAGGLLSPQACDALLDMCNGRHGAFRFLRGLFRKEP